jgi:copper chaperone CopZ
MKAIQEDKDKLNKNKKSRSRQESQIERTEKVTLSIKGMHCASCALNVEKALQRQAGVRGAAVNFAAETATVEYDSAVEKLEDLIALRERATVLRREK